MHVLALRFCVLFEVKCECHSKKKIRTQKVHTSKKTRNTFKAVDDSGNFETLSSRIVSVNAGHGELCSNFCLLENSSCPHSRQT